MNLKRRYYRCLMNTISFLIPETLRARCKSVETTNGVRFYSEKDDLEKSFNSKITILFYTKKQSAQIDVLTQMVPSIYIYTTAERIQLSPHIYDILPLEQLEALIEHKLKQYSQFFQLKQQYKQLMEFNTIAFHDLKNPIHHMNGFLSFIEADIKQENFEEVTEMIALALKEGKKTSDLISALRLYLSFLNEEQPNELILLNDVIDHVSMDLNINLSLPELPTINAPYEHIRHVFTEILKNSLIYNQAEIVEINISYTQTEKHHIVHIKDNGIGIPKDQLQRIPAPLVRLHSYSEYPGFGLGLSICSTILEKQGAFLHISSELEKGTEICIHFPK